MKLYLSRVLLFSIILGTISLHSCTREDHLIPIPNTVQFEQNLSTYNVYQGDWKELTPSDDFHLLEMSAALYSNHAKKQRLVKLPEGTQMVKTGDGLPDFPDGTILVKTFYYYQDERDESLGKAVIESRLLIKSEGQWNVAVYVWNETQTEATLDLSGLDTQVSWTDASGNNRSIPYRVPDETECVSCHQSNKAVMPIGPAMRNMNFEVSRNGTSINQLAHLQSIRILNDFDHSLISQIPNYKDNNVPLQERARAYMDMNCGHCHNPSAWSKSERTDFDFRFETAIGNTQILDQKNRVIETLEDGEMPYLGVTIIDEDGIDLILQYINSL